MKNILIPTDFSDTAYKALDYAAKLAIQFDSKLYVINTYEMPHSGSTVMVSLDDLLADESAKGLKSTAEYLDKKFPNLDYDTISKHGNFEIVIGKTVDLLKSELVVLGTTGASGVKGLLFGSNTAGLIRNVNSNLLVVPAKSEDSDFKNIAISTDLKFSLDDVIYQPVREVALAFSSRVNFINVTDKYKEEDLRAMEEKFGMDIDFVYGDNVEEGIQEYLEDKKTDLLVIVAEKHSLFHNIFKPSHSKMMAKMLDVPMMILTQ